MRNQLSESYLTQQYWVKDTDRTPWLDSDAGIDAIYDGKITSEYEGDNSLPLVTARDDATVVALAATKKIIIMPPNGAVSLELRFRSDGSANDENVMQLFAAAGVDHYDLMAQLTVIQGAQPYSATDGIYFCDYITPATEAWITAASEIDQATPADGIGRYVFNTHGYDRFWLVASDLVTGTVYVDWRKH